MLNFETSGSPSHLPLLLIHPLGADLRFWDECVSNLRDDFHCVTCDLPSAGGSPSPFRPPTIADQVDALLALLSDLEVERAAVVGTAVGGMAAAALAAKSPERIAALVVTNPGLYITPAARDALVDRVERLEKGGTAAILPAAVDRPFAGLPHDARYEAYMKRFERQDPHRYAHAIRGVLDADVRSCLPAILCPVLVISAEHEALMDPAHAEMFATAAPDARVVTLAASSHFLPYQAPDRFAALVRAFLQEHDLSK